MDLRFFVDESQMLVCDVLPQRGSLGLDDAVRVRPGHPEESVLARRIELVGNAQMPPLSRNQRDDEGSALVNDWITSLVSCAP
jgi:hypothetical protein